MSNKKRYYKLLQVLFWGFFIFFILLGILGVLYEEDIPFVGFFWLGVLVLTYLFIKRIIQQK